MFFYKSTLEQLRQQGEQDTSTTTPKGPRIMIVGPTDVGKSTVCRNLCNYAVRQGRTPIFIDLDVGQGNISVPGTIGALYINKIADVVEGFDKTQPLVYNSVSETAKKNTDAYHSPFRTHRRYAGHFASK